MSRSSENITSPIDLLPIGVFKIKRDGTILSISGGELDKLKLVQEKLIGENISRFKNLPIKKSHLNHATKVEELSANTKVDSKIYETFYVVNNKPDKDVNILGYFVDVTKQVEGGLFLDEKNFQAMISERFKALESMIGRIAHEINNPLAIIKGRAELLRDQYNNDTVDKSFAIQTIDSISKLSTKIGRLINHFGEVSGGNSRTDKDNFLVEEAVTSALQMCENLFESKEIRVDFSNSAKEVTVCGNKSQLIKVFYDLLINSFAAISDYPNPWVKIEQSRFDDHVKISVTDSGSGIPKNIINKVLEPLFTTKKLGEGLGLGLSMAKSVLDSHDGKLVIDQESEHTKVFVTLPTAS